MELSNLSSRRAASNRLQAGGGAKNSDSLWKGLGLGRNSRKKRSGSNDPNERLLGSDSSSNVSDSSFSSIPGVEGETIDPCVVCCTIFSACAAFLLFLLSIYAASDSEGKYLILRTSEQENPFEEEYRSAKAWHCFGAAILYLIFVAGCGYKWHKRQPLFNRK